jgi:uncharacterized membrane protein YidH (DUF202 family)
MTGQADPGNDPEEREALVRTSMAWTRTALAFAALGGTVLKANLITGLIVLAITPIIWQLGQVTRGGFPRDEMPVVGPYRLFAIAVAIVAVAAACLIIAIFGKSVPGALR